jgi:hypothetical protein
MAQARKLLQMALVGAIGGTLCDQIHVQFGVLWYPHPVGWLFGQAIWVPLLFAVAGPVLVWGHAPLLRGRAVETPSRAGVVVPAALFVAAYFSTGLFGSHPIALGAALTAAWALRVAWRPTADKIVAGISMAVLAPLFEAALSSTGAFHYREPGPLGVPLWLPGLYLHLSLLTRYIYLAFIAPPSARSA